MTFLETIKIKNGEIYNFSYHNRRMQQTARNFSTFLPELRPKDINLPEELSGQLVKCRIVYDSAIREITFTPYTFRPIHSLRIIEDNNIEYSFKSTARERINTLFSLREECDDIIIIKNGKITDTSFTNVVFENEEGLFTPSAYLLNGTQRQYLLEQHVIRETDISLSDLPKYNRIHLINAMINLADNISLPINNLKR